MNYVKLTFRVHRKEKKWVFKLVCKSIYELSKNCLKLYIDFTWTNIVKFFSILQAASDLT